MQVRFNPWSQLSQLEKDVLSFFDGGNRNFSRLKQNGEATKAPTWEPAVDVYEDTAKILLVADLPGVEDKDLSIAIDKNVLTLKGERNAGPKPEGDVHRHAERVQGPFLRAFTLPPTVDGERIAAELKAGVLTVTLPKKSEAQPRQIKVSAS